LKTYHVHIEGCVQGVGFRPFIRNLAVKNKLNGTVANTPAGVHIYFNAENGQAGKFVEQIKNDAPSRAIITSLKLEEQDLMDFEGFSIDESRVGDVPDLLITPDFGICPECRQELLTPNNRRYHYPFITCTTCGPRYSILNGLPYDRERTMMSTFRICPDCGSEYENPDDRRFYSQTNSCPNCAISLWVVDQKGMNLEVQGNDTISFVCEKLNSGDVVAVKGIGGFLLMCDASNTEAVARLRKNKARPSKPFAVMYPSIADVERDFDLSAEEVEELLSPQAPIVLLTIEKSHISHELTQSIAPGLDRMGVMLPYTPIFELIMQCIGKPLVATSGNLHGEPITYRNKKAISNLHLFADYFLFNNRQIVTPQDDSVVVYSDRKKQRIVFRRSRGMAPAFLQQTIGAGFQGRILAMGALMKSSFCIWNNGRCHISQFLGDTMEFEAQNSYEKTLSHLMKLLHFQPDMVLIDKHPAYFATQYGRETAARYDAQIRQVQHHKAHFFAAMGENELLTLEEKILGVVFDGTGMGNDGAIWGGEFFLYESGKLTRVNHLQYYRHILGDKMAREPRLSAFALAHSSSADLSRVLPNFQPDEQDYYQKVLRKSSLNTSSMGRLFDAVASLLGICQINSYEGEAAMNLEALAKSYFINGIDYPPSYAFEILEDGSVTYGKIINAIIDQIRLGVDPGFIAVEFHRTVVEIIRNVAEVQQTHHLVFSGGVMQNSLLVDMIIDLLGNDYQLYFHKQLSPNDECIAYGQLVAYYAGNAIGPI